MMKNTASALEALAGLGTPIPGNKFFKAILERGFRPVLQEFSRL
jgi:hypothetical protein